MRKEYTFTNSKQEKIIVVLTETEHDRTNKKGLMNLWVKSGLMERFIPKTINIATYVYEINGDCVGKYNPQIVPGKNKINFAWMLESTPENERKIIEEIKRLAEI